MPWETTEENIRSGHNNPDKFDPDSFRTIDITTGIKAVIGCPKGNYENGKCKVGTEVQSYLFDKAKFNMKEAKAWFKEHEGGKKEEEKMDEKLSWVQEIEQAFRAMDEKEMLVAFSSLTEEQIRAKIVEIHKAIQALDDEMYPRTPPNPELSIKRATLQSELQAYEKALAEILEHKVAGSSKIKTDWKASFNYNAGTMMAELLPDFKTVNKNGFFLDKSLKEKILAKLNSGKVFLTDSHDRTLRAILGMVTKGFDKDGKIKIEADIDPNIDPKIDKLLRKYKDNLGVSLEGPGAGYCTVCGHRVRGMERCLDHPKASIVVKEFDLRKVSLTDDPAWETSRVENYV